MSESENRNRPHDRTGVLNTAKDACRTPSKVSLGPAAFVEVPLDERLADNPLNARHSVGELDGLAASIRARGLLQPLIVARAETFRLAHPGALTDEDAEWILLAGHRRRAAARRAGTATAIAIVRDDLVKTEDSATVTLVENVHRAGLSPLEEARVLSVLRDLGLSQREISRQTGISQSQVSKRLQLLDLPAELQDCIDDGSLAVADALTVLHEISDPQDQLRAFRLSQAGGRSLKHVLTQLKHGRSARNLVVDQLPGHGTESSDEQRPETEDHDEQGTGSSDTQKELDEHSAASAARIEACRRAVRSHLSVDQVTDVLVDATLDPPLQRSAHARDQAHSMAAEWTGTLLPKAMGTGMDVPTKVLQGAREAAQRLAVAIVFAYREIDLAHIAHSRRPWHAASRRHIRRLTAWGLHVPTAYERARLTEFSEELG